MSQVWESVSGRRSRIDDGSPRSHQRVQCEKSDAGLWWVCWPVPGGCPYAQGDDDFPMDQECGCFQDYVGTWDEALAIVREKVDALAKGER